MVPFFFLVNESWSHDDERKAQKAPREPRLKEMKSNEKPIFDDVC